MSRKSNNHERACLSSRSLEQSKVEWKEFKEDSELRYVFSSSLKNGETISEFQSEAKYK